MVRRAVCWLLTLSFLPSCVLCVQLWMFWRTLTQRTLQPRVLGMAQTAGPGACHFVDTFVRRVGFEMLLQLTFPLRLPRRVMDRAFPDARQEALAPRVRQVLRIAMVEPATRSASASFGSTKATEHTAPSSSRVAGPTPQTAARSDLQKASDEPKASKKQKVADEHEASEPCQPTALASQLNTLAADFCGQAAQALPLVTPGTPSAAARAAAQHVDKSVTPFGGTLVAMWEETHQRVLACFGLDQDRYHAALRDFHTQDSRHEYCSPVALSLLETVTDQSRRHSDMTGNLRYVQAKLSGQAKCALAGCDKAKKLKSCARCKVTFYCGASHQRQDWPRHKAECKALASAP